MDTAQEIELPLNIQEGPGHYDEVMVVLVLRESDERVLISKHREKVLISGRPSLLTVLAENIDTLVQGINSDGHLHIEYHVNHFYLDERSEPAAVELRI